jgi:hypothetical protein
VISINSSFGDGGPSYPAAGTLAYRGFTNTTVVRPLLTGFIYNSMGGRSWQWEPFNHSVPSPSLLASRSEASVSGISITNVAVVVQNRATFLAPFFQQPLQGKYSIQVEPCGRPRGLGKDVQFTVNSTIL